MNNKRNDKGNKGNIEKRENPFGNFSILNEGTQSFDSPKYSRPSKPGNKEGK